MTYEITTFSPGGNITLTLPYIAPSFAAAHPSTSMTGLLYIPVNYWLVIIALLFGLMIGLLVGRALAAYEWNGLRVRHIINEFDKLDVIHEELHRLEDTYPGYDFELTMHQKVKE